MNSSLKTARITGVLFIIATVAASIGYIFILDPLLKSPEYLVQLSANENQVLAGMLLALINCAAIVGIAVAMYPILKRTNPVLAVGYIGTRIIECAIFIVGLISLLSLLTLSQEFLGAAAPAGSGYQASGTILLAAYDWSFWLAVTLVLGLSALILNYILYRSRLVPRWISAWGVIAGALVFTQGLLELFSLISPEQVMLFSAPIALQEMVLAVWLILKGFNNSVPAKTDINKV